MQNTNTTRKRRVGKIALVAALPVALFSGCVGGIAISDGDGTDATAAEPQPTATVTATPEPAPTVTETAEPEPAPTVTETAEPEIETVIEEVEVEVETVPFSCTEAIEAGDVLIESMLSWGDYVTTAEMEVAEDAAFDWGFWSEVCKDAAG